MPRYEQRSRHADGIVEPLVHLKAPLEQALRLVEIALAAREPAGAEQRGRDSRILDVADPLERGRVERARPSPK